MDDFTLVCGVDKKHLEQLHLTFPTWAKHKPSILKRSMLLFYDHQQVSPVDIRIDHPRLELYPWPPKDVTYNGGTDKWTDPQRSKMLAGFVHVPAIRVSTPYMLKLDTDVVATGQDDWIPELVPNTIISHRWNFTKPPTQMLKLDEWVKKHPDELHEFYRHPPLQLRPQPGSDRLGHSRIISWCAFFEMDFIRLCAGAANRTVGRYQLPVPSQDGFLWYCAKRMGLGIQRMNFKKMGFEVWATRRNIQEAVKRSLKGKSLGTG